MNIQELINRYDFHDSLIECIYFDQKEKDLTIDIDFCCWAQEGYIESDPETKMIKVKFKNVNSYEGLSGVIDSYSIDNIKLIGNDITIIVCDDFHSEYYEIKFNSDCVEINNL